MPIYVNWKKCDEKRLPFDNMIVTTNLFLFDFTTEFDSYQSEWFACCKACHLINYFKMYILLSHNIMEKFRWLLILIPQLVND